MLIDILKQALEHWHREDVAMARHFFQQLYNQLNQLSPDECHASGKFFLEQGLHEQALVCLERFLTFQYDEGSLKSYLQLIAGQLNEEKRLLKMFECYEERLSIEIAIDIVRRLEKIESAQQAYTIAIRLLDRVEKQFEKTGDLTFEHVALTDWIVTQDVKRGFITQARFQLRKLLHVKMTIVQHERLIHWAILLELTDCLMARKDFRTIQENVNQLYKDLLEFYVLLKQKQTSNSLATRLNEYRIDDAWLRDKTRAIVQMIQVLLKKGANKQIVQQLYEARATDFLIAKLYLLHFQPSSEEFWEFWLQQHGDLEEAVRWYRKFHPLKKGEAAQFEVAFLGGGEKIGGTAILVKKNGRAILLDAGMFLQEDTLLTNFSLLAQHGLSIGDLDAVLVSHAHLDHTGSLPYISKVAPHIPIYATAETARLMQILLRNVVEHEKQAPYSERHIGQLYLKIERVRYKEPIQVGDWRITFFEAGHIVGAASIYIEMAGKSLLFTGDFSVEAQSTCGVFNEAIRDVDVLITESTYGYMPPPSRLHRKEQEKILYETIESTVMNGGTCLIPTFAVGRAQEILSILQQRYDGYFPFTVFIDGGVPQVCDVYESTPYFELSNQVQNARDYYRKGQLKQFMKEQAAGSVIITSSGMLNEDSASSLYAYEMIDNPKNTIIFTGYLAPTSPAYALYKLGATRFKIEGQPWKEVCVKMRSHAMSAHINRDELFRIIQKIAPKKVLLMHGEHERQYSPIHSTAVGTEVYPTITNLLKWSDIPTICAKNNETYSI